MNETDKKTKKFYNVNGLYFFTATIGFSCLWAVYFLFFNNTIDLGEYEQQTDKTQEVSQDQGPSKEEQERPWISTESLITQGSKVYATQCAVCHGVKGLGDGTPGLIPAPRNLVEGKWKLGGSSKALFTTLQKGIEGSSMVSFKHLPKLDRWALVHYIRSITNNKVPDDEKELEDFASQAL